MISINDFSKELRKVIKEHNNPNKKICDLGDIGNIIGMTLHKFINMEEIGFHKVDFDIGVGHGISLKDGTH